MPGFDNYQDKVQYEFPEKRVHHELLDVSFAQGWMVDICSVRNGVDTIVYHDCALITLARASSVFESLALQHCFEPMGYGQERRIRYGLPSSIAAPAFLRIYHWVRTIEFASQDGNVDVMDPQITTFEEDGLYTYLRLLQAANALELKYPYHNQKRLPNMINANIKKLFDTRNNNFRDITISEREVALIWDMNNGDRNNTNVKLLLAMFVDAMDVRLKEPKRFKDNILKRFTTMMDKNAEFRSAVIDVQNKKNTRLREEDRERKGLPRGSNRRSSRGGTPASIGSSSKAGSPRKGRKSVVTSDEGEKDWRECPLDDEQVKALMSRAEEFTLVQKRGHGRKGSIQPL